MTFSYKQKQADRCRQ